MCCKSPRKNRSLKGLVVRFIFCLLLGIALPVKAQYEYVLHGMGGNMKSHSVYNQNMDGRQFRGLELEQMWLVNNADSSGSGPISTIKMVGVSAFAFDLGDQLHSVNYWRDRNLPVMGRAVGLMTKAGTKTAFGFHFANGRGINQLRWQFGGGFLLANQVYDSIKNPLNEAMSFPLNFAAQTRLEFVSHITKQLSLGVGAYAFHTSNSNWRKPNVGLNYVGVDFAIHYRLHERHLRYARGLNSLARTTVNESKVEIQNADHCYTRFRQTPHEKWELALKGAAREYRWDRPVMYNCYIGSLQYQLGKSFWRLGMDVFFEKGSGRLQGGGLAGFGNGYMPINNRVEAGLYLRKVIRFGWVDMFLDLGGYLIPPQADRVKDLSKNAYFYNALGAQYHLNKHWSLLHRIKAHKNIADYMEFGLSYCW